MARRMPQWVGIRPGPGWASPASKLLVWSLWREGLRRALVQGRVQVGFCLILLESPPRSTRCMSEFRCRGFGGLFVCDCRVPS